MLHTILTRIGWFLLLLALQVLLFNHIHIDGYATPMTYVFILILLPSNTPRWLYLTCGFVMGLAVDIFSSTPGMAAASMTLSGLVTPVLLKMFTPRDFEKGDALLPSSRSLEWGPFVRFVTLITLINTSVFFIIEAFTISNWEYLLASIASSTVVTLIFIIALELIRGTNQKR